MEKKEGHMISADELWPTLEALGEDEVRKHFVEGRYGHHKAPLVKAWLDRKASERGADVAQKQESREEKALQLSAEANSIARGSKTVAFVAIVVSVLALVVAIVGVLVQATK
ncbi:hypothetical protein ACFL2T_02375 [Elusimicrobiota bacterium]